MKRLVIYISIFVLSFSVYSQKNSDFPSWLQGVWEIQSESGSSFEKWNKVTDSLFLGKTFRIINYDTIVFDTMKIKIADAKVIYEMSATIGNTPVYAGYPLERPDPSVWTFRNFHIDYPLSINYMRIGTDSVYVWTEAKDNGVACMDYLLIRHGNE